MSETKLVLFDNNVYRRLLKREDRMTQSDFEWRASILDWINQELLPSYQIVFTPLGFLEAVGQKITDYPTFDFTDSDLDASQRLTLVQEDSRKYFSELEYLTPASLKKRAEEQLNYTSTEPVLRRIYDDTIGRFCATPNAHADLCDYLAYDVLQTVDYHQAYDEAHMLLLREILHAISNGINVSAFRTMNQMYLKCHATECRETKTSTPPVFKIRPREDLLDADWIHAASFGLMLDGSMKSVHVVTADPEQDVINRVCWAKLCWTEFLCELTDPARFPFEVPRPQMGVLYVTDSESGSLGKKLCVNQLMLEGDDINGYAT